MFLNDTIIRKCSKENNRKYLSLGNNERKFVTTLQKQPKNKGKDVLLFLLKKKGLSLSQKSFYRTLIGLLIFGSGKIESLQILDLRKLALLW